MLKKLYKNYILIKDLVHFMLIVVLILLGWLVIVRKYYDFFLVSFYLLYVAQIIGGIYLINHRHEYFRHRILKDLILERNVLSLLALLVVFGIVMMHRFGITFAIILIVYFFLMLVIIQTTLVALEVRKHQLK